MADHYPQFIPTQWKRGLVPIPVIYCLGLLLAVFLGSCGESIRSAKRELETLNASINEVAQAKDHAAMERVSKQLQQCNDRLFSSRCWNLGTFAMLVASTVAFCWFVWQVTTYPVSNWEIWARRIILALPLLFILRWSRAYPDIAVIASVAAAITVATGIQRAYMKICVASGNFDIGNKIFNLYQCLFRLVAVSFGLGMLAEIFRLRKEADLILPPLIYIGAIGILLLMTRQLWQLRQRLDQNDDPWGR